MPARGVKVKKMQQKGSVEDANLLNDMFSQMTGSNNADSDIIIPKFIKLKELVTKYFKIFNLLINFDEFIKSFPEYTPEFDDIRKFLEKLEKIKNDDELTEKKLSDMNNDNVNKLYKELKNNNEIQTMVIISGNLDKYKKYLSDKANLGDEFIKREPGLSLKPLTFTNLDLKLLWSSEKLTSMAKKYILNILSNTYSIGHEVYQIITSPDIDIKKFSSILIANIDKMKKQIPRCDKAFDIIAKSVSMLENNFDGYYKTSVEAENPSIIIESFIVDVSMSQKSNATTTSQFRKIIMFMKRQTASIKDPRVSKLFKILNSQFNLMKSETGTDPAFEEKNEPEEDIDEPEEKPEEEIDEPEEKPEEEIDEPEEKPEEDIDESEKLNDVNIASDDTTYSDDFLVLPA